MAATASRKKGDKPRARRKLKPLEVSHFNICGVTKEYRKISIVLLRPGRYQTRVNFNERRLKELADSLRATGMNFTPLIVRPIKGGEGYEIICGERRWRAAQEIGLDSLLCCVGDFTDQQAIYLSGADNIQREGLGALEEAQSYELMVETGLSHEAIAEDIGRSRGHVSNYLRLLKLPLTVRDYLSNEKLTFAHARPLCSLPMPGQQVSIAHDAVRKGWTAQKVEQEVAKLLAERKRKPVASRISEDANIKRLKELVSEQTGYPCAIVRTPSGGWQLGLSASSAEEFQGILDRLSVNTDSA